MLISSLKSTVPVPMINISTKSKCTGTYLFISEGQVDMFGSSSIEGWLQIQLSNQVKIQDFGPFFYSPGFFSCTANLIILRHQKSCFQSFIGS